MVSVEKNLIGFSSLLSCPLVRKHNFTRHSHQEGPLNFENKWSCPWLFFTLNGSLMDMLKIPSFSPKHTWSSNGETCFHKEQTWYVWWPDIWTFFQKKLRYYELPSPPSQWYIFFILITCLLDILKDWTTVQQIFTPKFEIQRSR